MKKEYLKKDGQELQDYLRTMRRHNVVPTKKGKGAKYNRQQFKNERKEEE